MVTVPLRGRVSERVLLLAESLPHFRAKGQPADLAQNLRARACFAPTEFAECPD